jgi:hypothetical protein
MWPFKNRKLRVLPRYVSNEDSVGCFQCPYLLFIGAELRDVDGRKDVRYARYLCRLAGFDDKGVSRVRFAIELGKFKTDSFLIPDICPLPKSW